MIFELTYSNQAKADFFGGLWDQIIDVLRPFLLMSNNKVDKKAPKDIPENKISSSEEVPGPGKEPVKRTGSGAEDLLWIDRFLEGDDEAFTQLVMKYQHKVNNLCVRVLGDRDEAKDMAQEVFITVHKSLKNFRGDSLFSTWIFRVTINHCKNRIKFLGRRAYYRSVSMDKPKELDDGSLMQEFESGDPDPETLSLSNETQRLVQEAISQLDEDHRTAIVLRDIQDLSYEEIADVLEIKVGTVKSRIHRARSELKIILEDMIEI